MDRGSGRSLAGGSGSSISMGGHGISVNTSVAMSSDHTASASSINEPYDTSAAAGDADAVVDDLSQEQTKREQKN